MVSYYGTVIQGSSCSYSRPFQEPCKPNYAPISRANPIKSTQGLANVEELAETARAAVLELNRRRLLLLKGLQGGSPQLGCVEF